MEEEEEEKVWERRKTGETIATTLRSGVLGLWQPGFWGVAKEVIKRSFSVPNWGEESFYSKEGPGAGGRSDDVIFILLSLHRGSQT